jgi:integrase/recombinase XerD
MVQRVVMPITEAVSWTVLDDGGVPLVPVEAYLAHLAALERSPETVRGYAVSLKLWFEFLAAIDVGWDEATIDDVARFVAWLRAPAANVVVMEGGTARRSPGTVNRCYLAGVFGFYDHHGRSGAGLAGDLVAWRRVNRGGYKPFLHGIGKSRPIPTRPVKLNVPRQAPRALQAEQVMAILAACEHLRDQFLVALLAETGMRVGQALGLRHADFVSRSREVHIVPRTDNANGARAKTRSRAVIPISVPLVRLYSAYMHGEYGQLDSDYVFVNLWAHPYGHPLSYQAVHKLLCRLRDRTGIEFTAHMLRHTHATDLIRRGVPIEVVARLLTHRSSTTTSSTYIHLNPEDLRDQLLRHGIWNHQEEDR